MKKIHTIFILLIILTFLFSACKDDPYIPVKPPDPTPTNNDMYFWEVKNINGKLKDIYVADTSHVYIIKEYYSLLRYYNGTINEMPLNDFGFMIISIDGYDNENFFVGGGLNGTPTLKKIQHGGVITYHISNDLNNSLYDVFCTGPNEVWLSTTSSNFIYRFNSGNFTRFQLNDSVFKSFFYKDITGQLFTFGIYSNSFEVADLNKTSQLLYTYRFENDTFRFMRKDTITLTITGANKFYFLHRCGPDLIMINAGENPIAIFTGSDWENYLGLPPEPQFRLSQIGGISKDSLILFAATERKLYIWDGNWHKEDSFYVNNSFLYPLSGPTVHIKDPNVYFTISSLSDESYFIIGRRNKKDKNEEIKRLIK